METRSEIDLNSSGWRRTHELLLNEDVVDALFEKVTELESEYSESTGEIPEWRPNTSWHSKVIPIVQSSGSGKSALVHGLGDKMYTARFKIRKIDYIMDFPPRDRFLSGFLMEDSTTKKSWCCDRATAELHARIIGFLTGVFEEGKFETPNLYKY
ncbi:hypothetical protein MMC14_009473 [Varicellaria rhodocarpa]|nr:hypothetical protein [Varicellaria rhodocarpa]